MKLTELSVDAMGTHAHVVIGDGEPRHAAMALEAVDRLERLWSRFIADSEISRANASPGEPVPASPETIELVERAVEAWELTGGLFDPTLLGDLVDLGYDRTFRELETLPPQQPAEAGLQASGARGRPEVSVDRGSATITVGDRGIDSGGIGKGLAADMVATMLVEAGAAAALVNLGGDLRTAGAAPRGGWLVDVAHPFNRGGPPAGEFRLDGQALVTSSSQGRRWSRDGEENHHLLDPATGRSALSDIALVTVIDAEGWRAEALSKAAFLQGRSAALEMLPAHGAQGMVVGRDGSVEWTAGCRPFRVPEKLVARRR
ncbi:MAG: FAD:protein FMN transferase [Solirubrobacterales bacterium]